MQISGELLGQGLTLTLIGMGLVFAALAFMWGVIALLGHVSAPEAGEPIPNEPAGPELAAEPSSANAVTAERARVAALVAAALMANAVPLHREPPVGPTFEHGRTAPAWVTTNRARVMRPWQPPRSTDDGR